MATTNRPRRTLEARAGETGRRANARGVRAARRALASAEAPREVPRREPRGTTSRPERGGRGARAVGNINAPSVAPSWRSRVHRRAAGRQKARLSPDALGFGAALLGAHVGRRVARARGARGARSRRGDVRGGARGRHPRQAPSKARGRRVRAGAKSVRLARPPSPRRGSPDAPNAPPRPLPRAAHLSLAARLDRRPRTIPPVSHASPHPPQADLRQFVADALRTSATLNAPGARRENEKALLDALRAELEERVVAAFSQRAWATMLDESQGLGREIYEAVYVAREGAEAATKTEG